MWQKQQKIKQWGTEVVDFNKVSFFPVETPCTVLFCLENASKKIFFMN